MLHGATSRHFRTGFERKSQVRVSRKRQSTNCNGSAEGNFRFSSSRDGCRWVLLLTAGGWAWAWVSRHRRFNDFDLSCPLNLTKVGEGGAV